MIIDSSLTLKIRRNTFRRSKDISKRCLNTLIVLYCLTVCSVLYTMSANLICKDSREATRDAYSPEYRSQLTRNPTHQSTTMDTLHYPPNATHGQTCPPHSESRSKSRDHIVNSVKINDTDVIHDGVCDHHVFNPCNVSMSHSRVNVTSDVTPADACHGVGVVQPKVKVVVPPSADHYNIVNALSDENVYSQMLIPVKSGLKPNDKQCVLPQKIRKDLASKKAAFFDLNCPSMVNCKLTDNATTWEHELKSDPDKDYILQGVSLGFDILEGKSPEFSADSVNYKSATVTSRSKAEKQIKQEIRAGNYVPVLSKPQVVSSIGAIPKNNGSVRLIHDLSRPKGGVNAFVDNSSVSYKTVDQATELIKRGAYLCKVDLKSAYRSIPINPKNYKFMGLSWLFDDSCKRSFFVDTKLPFGSRKACYIFTRLSNAIARMLHRKNVTTVNYLDDILIISENKSQSWLDLDKTINLLVSLGLDINWDKVEPPTQSLSFLGVQIDTVKRVLSLPPLKLAETKDLINTWLQKKRASKKQILSLLGKLNWCCRVVFGGRTFMRNIINLTMKLRSNNHRTWLDVETRKDISWWAQALDVFHGYTPFPGDMPPPQFELSTDACRRSGGGTYMHDWFYSDFKSDYPALCNEHINVLEMLSVLIAAKRWGHLWGGHHIRLHCDNSAVVYSINKGSSKSRLLMSIIRELFWIGVKFNFRLTISHIRGVQNLVADMISRLHQKNMFCKFVNMFQSKSGFIDFSRNMSYETYLSLQDVMN